MHLSLFWSEYVLKLCERAALRFKNKEFIVQFNLLAGVITLLVYL